MHIVENTTVLPDNEFFTKEGTATIIDLRRAFIQANYCVVENYTQFNVEAFV